MVTPLTKFLKPYVLRVQLSSRQLTAHVVHRITSRLVAMCDSREASLREELSRLEAVERAARVGDVLAHRLKLKDVSQVVFHLGQELNKLQAEADKQTMLKAFATKLQQGGIELVD